MQETEVNISVLPWISKKVNEPVSFRDRDNEEGRGALGV
jgi:hypothetical protein